MSPGPYLAPGQRTSHQSRAKACGVEQVWTGDYRRLRLPTSGTSLNGRVADRHSPVLEPATMRPASGHPPPLMLSTSLHTQPPFVGRLRETRISPYGIAAARLTSTARRKTTTDHGGEPLAGRRSTTRIHPRRPSAPRTRHHHSCRSFTHQSSWPACDHVAVSTRIGGSTSGRSASARSCTSRR